MTKLQTPLTYINEPGLIRNSGVYIKEYGKRVYVAGTKSSYRAVEKEFFKSLEQEHLEYRKVYFEGYPTFDKAKKVSEDIKKYLADVVVAIGGGRVLDGIKASASLAGVPVITIPTIAATSAAYRCDPILYDDKGGFVKTYPNQESPVLILADTEVILKAPIRYLHAGIIDSLAKWYESRPYVRIYPNDLKLKIAIGISKSVYDFLSENLDLILSEAERGIVSDIGIQAVDAIIAFPGMAGSYSSPTKLPGFAHPFYNELTRKRTTKDLLHGEIIGYGLLTQFILEGREESEILKELELFEKLGYDYDLEDTGILQEFQIDELTDVLWNEYNDTFKFLSHIKDKVQYKKAIIKVDSMITSRRGLRKTVC